MSHESSQHRPLLVVVNGPPASGKSTLAEEIAKSLQLPFLSKDALKEEMYDSLGKIERTISRALGETSMKLMYSVADLILRAGGGVVIEANFYRGISEKDLSRLIAISTAVMVQCSAPAEVLTQRYAGRAEAGERHPVHQDSNRIGDLKPEIEKGQYDPLDLGIPLIRVDTSDGFDPAPEEIVVKIHALSEMWSAKPEALKQSQSRANLSFSCQCPRCAGPAGRRVCREMVLEKSVFRV